MDISINNHFLMFDMPFEVDSRLDKFTPLNLVLS